MSLPRIFVIIDEPALKYLFSINLYSRGYEVKVLPGSNDLLSNISQFNPDLVILDLMVHEIDGFNICKFLCKTNVSHMIAFNMRGGDNDLLKCLEMGVDDYIGKPFGIDELIARINAVLRHRRFEKPNHSETLVEWSKTL
jgi:DNA-binding response OmpR family regulator